MSLQASSSARMAGLLGAAILFGATHHAEAGTIRIAFPSGQQGADYEGALVFKHFVETGTRGEVSVEIHSGDTLCPDEAACIGQLQAGDLEAAVSTVSGLAEVFLPGQVLGLPYILPDDRVAECVFDGPFTAGLRDAVLDEVGTMRLMAIANAGGWRHFATVGQPVRRPEDVQGMAIRTTPVAVQVETVRMLGGAPAPIAWPEVEAALAAGLIEGTGSSLTEITGMQLEEHLDHITLDGHAYVAAVWWINQDFFMGLPVEHRKVVHDGFQHLKTVTRALLKRRAIDAYKAFEAAGGAIHMPDPEEKQAFEEATAGMKDWFKSQYGDTWLIKLEKAVADCEAQIEAEYATFTEE